MSFGASAFSKHYICSTLLHRVRFHRFGEKVQVPRYQIMLISLLCFVTKSRWEGERYWEGRWINSSLFFPSYLLGDRGVLFKLRGFWVIFAVELHWCNWILSWAMCMKNPCEQGNPPRHCPGRTSIKLLAAVLEGSGSVWDWDLPDEPAQVWALSWLH